MNEGSPLDVYLDSDYKPNNGFDDQPEALEEHIDPEMGISINLNEILTPEGSLKGETQHSLLMHH
jgi:hypothetical protein